MKQRFKTMQQAVLLAMLAAGAGQAMAAKTPVVATRKGGVVSVIEDKVNGFFIRPRNSKEIAQTVNMLLLDDELRQKLAANAYKRVVEHFTWEKIAGEFEGIYKQFKYSTSEYLARVKGTNPKLSDFMRTANRMRL